MVWPNLTAKMLQLGALPNEELVQLAFVLQDSAEDVLKDSKTKEPLVPRDTGALERSGQVSPAIIRNNTVDILLVYGGPSSPHNVNYAGLVHEDMTRTYKRPGSGPKFVSTHFERRRVEIEDKALGALDDAVRKVKLPGV